MADPVIPHSSDNELVSLRDLVNLFCGANGGAVVSITGSGLPYGADSQALSYYPGTNNLHTIAYSNGGVLLKTRTFSYAGGGVVNDDVLTGTLDA